LASEKKGKKKGRCEAIDLQARPKTNKEALLLRCGNSVIASKAGRPDGFWAAGLAQKLSFPVGRRKN